ncbi:membrane protein CcdC involved in cytochrome C biogenesis [Paenibacillus phyllosphaerae]|uniref:Membrane protein CcdC involved in cytochrome C biogenesis n=1 Tax=Paenibacillus phyllosphaerae TaxID=274593 RepID=A0A7W5B181_9BACL|nr:cytochrome c biogenesis protein CcdC [Paenibacillus phyllosphaerae]MBB3112518.1 membrane protein CcdC involved in cytochrome C biogenesis [Paenibacillus phyllosphaerae]
MNGYNLYVIIAAIAALVLWRRTRSMYRPIRGNGIRLLVPMIFILPGLALVNNPEVNEPAWALALAFGLGAAFSIPLIWTTNYEVREDNNIYAQKNWGFIVAFLGVLIIRVVLRQVLTDIEPQDLMALFMMVAFGYLIPWRLVSFIKFRRLVSQTDTFRRTGSNPK